MGESTPFSTHLSDLKLRGSGNGLIKALSTPLRSGWGRRAKFFSRIFGNRFLETGFWKPVSGNRFLKTRFWKTGFWKPVFGKPVFGNPFLENQFLETRFWKTGF